MISKLDWFKSAIMHCETTCTWGMVENTATQCSRMSMQCSGMSMQCSGMPMQCSGLSMQCSGLSMQCSRMSMQCSGENTYSVPKCPCSARECPSSAQKSPCSAQEGPCIEPMTCLFSACHRCSMQASKHALHVRGPHSSKILKSWVVLAAWVPFNPHKTKLWSSLLGSLGPALPQQSQLHTRQSRCSEAV